MVVYGIFDLKSKKVYVGKTTKTLEVRWEEHKVLFRKNKGNPFLRRIFLKDPLRLSPKVLVDNIVCEVELNRLEIELIGQYRLKTGVFNLTNGGDGGNTWIKLSKKRQKQIMQKRSKDFPTKKGKLHPSFISLSQPSLELIKKTWIEAEVKCVSTLAKKVKISKYVCRRALVELGFLISDRKTVQRELIKRGINKPSRFINWSVEDIEKIKELYLKDFVGCKQIALRFGLKSEDPIKKVLREQNVSLHTKSAMARFQNLKRSKNGKYKES